MRTLRRGNLSRRISHAIQFLWWITFVKLVNLSEIHIHFAQPVKQFFIYRQCRQSWEDCNKAATWTNTRGLLYYRNQMTGTQLPQIQHIGFMGVDSTPLIGWEVTERQSDEQSQTVQICNDFFFQNIKWHFNKGLWLMVTGLTSDCIWKRYQLSIRKPHRSKKSSHSIISPRGTRQQV